MDEGKWLYCPKCNKTTRVKVYEQTKWKISLCFVRGVKQKLLLMLKIIRL